jgi:hypothetical protein
MKLSIRMDMNSGLKLYRKIKKARGIVTGVSVVLMLLFVIQIILTWQYLGTAMWYSFILTGVGVVFGFIFDSKKIRQGATPWWINKKL